VAAQFKDLLARCRGQRLVINGRDERTLKSVDQDFVVLQGGNPQMVVTEYIPLGQVVRLTRMEYAGGEESFSLDVAVSGVDVLSSAGH